MLKKMLLFIVAISGLTNISYTSGILSAITGRFQADPKNIDFNMPQVITPPDYYEYHVSPPDIGQGLPYEYHGSSPADVSTITNQNSSYLMPALLAGGLALTAGGVYYMMRESNDDLIKEVNELFDKTTREIVQADEFTFSDPAIKTNVLKIISELPISRLKKVLDGRYGNWIKPWDWTNAMSSAYNRVTVLSIYHKYKNLITQENYHALRPFPNAAALANLKATATNAINVLFPGKSADEIGSILKNDILAVAKCNDRFSSMLLSYLIKIQYLIA